MDSREENFHTTFTPTVGMLTGKKCILGILNLIDSISGTLDHHAKKINIKINNINCGRKNNLNCGRKVALQTLPMQNIFAHQIECALY